MHHTEESGMTNETVGISKQDVTGAMVYVPIRQINIQISVSMKIILFIMKGLLSGQ